MRSQSITELSEKRIFVMLINLDSRPDRLLESRIEAENADLSFLRIPAVGISDLDDYSADFLSRPAKACLESHLKCYRELIKSGYDFALVLEDDFQIKSRRKFARAISRCDWERFDLIQLGFLYMDFWHQLDIFLKLSKNFVFQTLGLISKCNYTFNLKMQSKLEIRKRNFVPPGFIVDDLRSGSHAYLISKKMAQELLDMSDAIYLPVDGFLGTLQYTNRFRLIRSKSSLVRQRKSLSSIK
jgi:GR25 family glycosyltransferase involved in LPS biosynthesis